MARTNKIETGSLDKIIIGRVDPYIYAFTTETIPNYLKVGDTYRPLETRLSEWKNYFPNLKKQFDGVAKVDGETFFRDYAIHLYLEQNKHKTRLDKASVPKGAYYSNEFFKETDVKDVKDAIGDIKDSHTRNDGKYQFYKFNESRIPEKHTYLREEDYTPRPNQQEAIDNFKTAVANGRTNLLMYAVMRFGKSFTSMCCATEMGADVVVIVSAKADVKEEWKKTVESHIRFEGYDFLDSGNLSQDYSIVTKKLEEGEKVVMFLTLQDLMGDKIKKRHKEIFERQIDLLIIDETHFGARGEKYGRVLKEDLRLTSKERRVENSKTNDEDIVNLDNNLKILSSKVRLHLSGTPYRILMGSEFKSKDIISFCQFSDITEAQRKWDEENLDKEDTDKTKIEEWKNPYYGFPQMVRFAFHPNASARKKLDELRQNGVTYAFSALFKPKSIQKDEEGGMHKIFEYEKEVLDLLEVIDGSKEDEELFGFLDYDKIKSGQMCRHIVCVLPFRASCDALEKLITDNKERFKNLGQYEIVNISGVENERLYLDTNAVKAKIHSCERDNQKTITLTVNRMLTGSTVEEWDTMLYLKDTSSPQEYDQATFRLQNQYIRKYTDDRGEEIHYNMKPQTLLVDLDPNRMFAMQERKSQIYNVNTDKNGNSKLRERIETELEISPIIAVNKGRIVAVEPADIMDAVREYSKNRSVRDEAEEIAPDYSLLKDEVIRAEIEKQPKIGSKQGLKIEATKGEGTDIDVPLEGIENGESEGNAPSSSKQEFNNIEEEFKKKFATYYSRVLFFAFLTRTPIISLDDLIAEAETLDGQRIANNLDLSVEVLKLLRRKINENILNNLDYKIQNINTLANDESLKPIERVSVAMRKFTQLSRAEIITPENVAGEMVNVLPEEEFYGGAEILDLAAKQGEFVYAIYKKFGKTIANNVYSIPTSKGAYEFTRKVYELLGLDISHIECSYNSYDLIKKETPMIKGDKIMINGQTKKFNVIISNPPYQEVLERTSDTPVYNHFMDLSFGLSSKVTLITPGRYLFNAGKTPSRWNKKILNDDHFKVVWYKTKSTDVFPDVDIKGGVAVMYRDTKQNFEKIGTYTAYPQLNRILKNVVEHNSFRSIDNLVYPQNKFNLDALYRAHPEIKEKIGSDGREKRLTTSIFSIKEIFKEQSNSDNDVEIIGLINNMRQIRYVDRRFLEPHINFEKYKVIIPKSNGAGAIGEILSTPLIGEPMIAEPLIGYTQSFIGIGAFKTIKEVEACFKYVRTKFARALLGVLKITQDNSKDTWANVPIQDFTANSDIDWSKSVAEIDLQLYDKYGLTTEERQFIEQMIRPM